MILFVLFQLFLYLVCHWQPSFCFHSLALGLYFLLQGYWPYTFSCTCTTPDCCSDHVHGFCVRPFKSTAFRVDFVQL